MGDGALVEFPSVIDAVTCALAIQNGIARRNEGAPEDHRIGLRVGVPSSHIPALRGRPAQGGPSTEFTTLWMC